jgi:hypothetical protein
MINMNENIKRLAEQADFVLWGDEDWNPGDVIDWAARYDDEFVRYTHLLVEDVFDRIRDESASNGVSTHEDLKNRVLSFYKDNT